MAQQIKVLIIDDSLVFREALARAFSSEPLLNVLPTASHPSDAWQKIKQYRPHIIICDIEMPIMNGIEFVDRLMKEMPTPTITLSSRIELKSAALQVGSSAFVSKPLVTSKENVQQFISQLISLILRTAHSENNQKFSSHDKISLETSIVAIGASTGGTEAIQKLIGRMPEQSPAILIVQHIPSGFSRIFAERLNQVTSLNVKEAKHGDLVHKGQVLVAPGNYHMKLRKSNHQYFVECSSGEKVNGHCPSVDILFHSVAKHAGKDAIGIIMTGMGKDGADGLLAMRNNGARTFAQDRQSSVVYGMPKAASEIGAVEKHIPLNEIHRIIMQCIK